MNPYFTKGLVSDKRVIGGDTPSLLIIKIKLLKPEIKTFRPGQFCTFRVGEGIFRSYSIASDYKNFSEYEFIISVAHEGIGSNYFKKIEIGDEVDFLGPSGHFKIEMPIAPNLIFCATGTGIAPFIPMIEFLLDNSCESKIALLHGMKNENNQNYYSEIHNSFKSKCENFTHKIYVSQPINKNGNFNLGRISEEIKKLDLTKHHNTQFYLCGHPDMVSEVSEYLLNNGIKEENVISEVFTSPGFYQREK